MYGDLAIHATSNKFAVGAAFVEERISLKANVLDRNFAYLFSAHADCGYAHIIELEL